MIQVDLVRSLRQENLGQIFLQAATGRSTKLHGIAISDI